MKYALLLGLLTVTTNAHAIECRYGSGVHGPSRGGGSTDGTVDLETIYNKGPSTITARSPWGREYKVEIRYFNVVKGVDSTAAASHPKTNLVITLHYGDQYSTASIKGPFQSTIATTLGNKDDQEAYNFFAACDFPQR